jgi:hypothetical protein
MKLADSVIDVHSAGVRSVSDFSIAQTSKMFKILSDSLYSDKIMAVIRELSTNAYDSHISAGNRNPFKVTLPNSSNPNFIVRDYGTGLSQGDMENLYTTYGASNKNDSNDFVGCLGLGSKSPFAYTKSFTSSSYYNGQKYTYVAALDDRGVPSLNLFSVTDTDEPNGLEISFAVKSHDFMEFTSKAIRIYHYFKMKPLIEGGVAVYGYFASSLKDHTYSNKNIVISGDNWRVCRLSSTQNFFPNVSHRIDSGVVAIMGNIAYPVQINQIIGEEKQEPNAAIQKWNRVFAKSDIDSWRNFVKEILSQNMYLELDFGIGELEMDVSREGLQYTKEVIKTVRNKTQDIFLEMKEEISNKIKVAKTKIEAITSYYSLNDLSGGWGVGAVWTNPVDGKVHPINSGIDLEYKLADGKNLYVFNYRSGGYRSRRLIYLTNYIFHNTLTTKVDWYNKSPKTGKIAFFVCDVKSEETAKKIVTRYCNFHNCYAYLMMDTKDLSKSNEGFEDIVNDVGEHNLLKVSAYKDLLVSVRKPGVTRASTGSVSNQDIFFITGESQYSGTLKVLYNDALMLHTLSKDEVDDFGDDKVIYVPITRYASINGYPSIREIKFLFDDKLKTMLGNPKIYAIKTGTVDKLAKEGYDLQDFNSWFQEILVSKIKPYFDKNTGYSDIINHYKELYSSMIENLPSRWNTNGKTATVVPSLAIHILSVYGLEYAQYITNKTLCTGVDEYLLMEFFGVSISFNEYNLRRFSKKDYYNHISQLLKNITNSSSISIEDLINASRMQDLIAIKINSLYKDSAVSSIYHKLIETDKNKNSKSFIKKFNNAKLLSESLKIEIDKNPVLKYIIGTASSSFTDLRELDAKYNSITQFSDRYDSNKGWFFEIDDYKFKCELAKVIN